MFAWFPDTLLSASVRSLLIPDGSARTPKNVVCRHTSNRREYD